MTGRYRASVVRGALVGAGALALWVAARYYPRERLPAGLIDWNRAAHVAERTSGADGRLTSAEKARLQVEYEALVRGIEGPIAEYTGTILPLGSTRVQVMDRADWIRANIANFRELFAPIDALYLETSEGSPLGLPVLGDAGRLLLSAQAGLLIGYLARKVLGQYDISLLGKEVLTDGKLYFVEPNIRVVERQLALPADELRRWIALHEATHAHEFEVNPWVRQYLNEHLQGYIASVIEDMRDARSATALVSRLVEDLRRGRNLLEAMMTQDQREVLSQLQALMSLAEGYSNHVMNQVGGKLLPHFEQIHERVEHRQKQRGRAEQLFLKLTGLQMKMEQYALGEKFASHVAERRGVAFLNRAWATRDHLPSEAEIRAPDLWIARLDSMVAA